MIRVLVDTNVLAQWYIIKSTVEGAEFFEKNIKEAYGRRAQSYEFVEYVIKNRPKKATFYVNSVILSELMNVLVEDFVYNSMWMDGISPVYFQRYYTRYLPSEKDLEDIISEVLEATSIIEAVFEKLGCEIEGPADYYNVTYFLGRGGVKTQDAHLLAIALKSGIDFFVTMDSGILNLTRKKDVREFLEARRLNIVKPKTMYNILRKL